MPSNKISPFIAIIDFGSQYSHLISRTLRDLNVPSKIFTPQVSLQKLTNAGGLILSGGPRSLLKNPIEFNSKILSLNVPILGLCYGHQLLADFWGGKLSAGQTREYGKARLTIAKPHRLFAKVPKTTEVWMSHGDSVIKLPPGFITLAQTKHLPIAAMASTTKPILGLQFHPEVHHTKYGRIILNNFAARLCHLNATTRLATLTLIEQQIKQQVGYKKVFLLVSGGVDSTVALALLNQALGKTKVYGLHIDTGLLRFKEQTQVAKLLREAGFTNLHTIKADRQFLNHLNKAWQPEHKRQIIGQTFVTVANQTMQRLKLNPREWLLGQGTIYPDTIESAGTKHAAKIKTHHNRVGLLQKFARQGLLVEPLKNLYKDEVRTLGKELGLPNELIWTHPFPGPGLAVRLLCLNKVEAKRLNADRHKLPNILLTKYDSRLLPIKSVGVQGDERSYARPLAVDASYHRAATIHKLANELTNKYQVINRVLLKIAGPKLNAGQAYPAFLTKPRIKLLQTIDHLITTEIKRAKAYGKLWQCPVILIPFGRKHRSSIVLRPFASREAMTGEAYLLSPRLINTITAKIKGLKAIDYIFYDLTDKPPGTIEWE
ncbi:MAG: glutamine-hydrolyzing GMP synthase [Candidatus Kerfeldbacteria bacterium]|nr:glutamine-hydrolyzing GMP synthase [Candidatus Kerfeldbacteria bacterium]